MNDTSKKVYIFRTIVVVIIIILFVIIGVVFYMFNNIALNENIIETTSQVEEKKEVIFDLTLSPKKQRKKIINNTKEYLKQVYEYIILDEKIRKCMPYDLLTGYEIVEDFIDAENLYNTLIKFSQTNYIITVFDNTDRPLTDLPVTGNYIKNHPEPLRKEFSKYFREDYEKQINNNEALLYMYEYNIGIDKEKKQIIATEHKSISFRDKNMGVDAGVVYGKPGSIFDGRELYADLKEIYFNYTLDEKGYVDDVSYDHVLNLVNEKEFDDSCSELQ